MCFLQPVIKTIYICTDLSDRYHSALLPCKVVVTTSTVTTEVGTLILPNIMSGIPPQTPSADL